MKKLLTADLGKRFGNLKNGSKELLPSLLRDTGCVYIYTHTFESVLCALQKNGGASGNGPPKQEHVKNDQKCQDDLLTRRRHVAQQRQELLQQ